jgi:Uma2 family endonuclease
MAIADAPTRHTGPLTYADLPTEPDDGLRYELIDGALIVTPSPNTAHQLAVTQLVVLLHAALPDGLALLVAPYDWKVSELTVLQPDLVVARRADLGRLNLQVPPVLAIEILSPSTRRIDLGLKRETYRDAGLEHYWVIDLDAPSITAWRFGDEGEPTATVTGDDVFSVDDPLPASFSVSALLQRTT